MAQRKKKGSSFQKQKIAKAQHRNEFIRKLKHIIDTINGKEVSSLFPRFLIDKIYAIRTHSFKIIVAPGSSVPSFLLNEIRATLSFLTKDQSIVVIPGKLEVTLDDFFSVFLTASLNLEIMLTDDIRALEPFKRKLKKFNTGQQTLLEKASMDIYSMLLSLVFYHNDISKTQYWLNHDITTTSGSDIGLYNVITINSYKIESSSIVINDNHRLVTKIGYALPNFGIDWVAIKPSVLNIDNVFADIPLDVYIQSHALNRLSERIDCFPTGSVHYNMFSSLKEPVVFYDSSNNPLIEFRYFGMKAGYFVVNITQGMIVIRTFLFVTNSGTPEGQKLENITGLRKLDKKYLAIDKLSTFMSSDIGDNEKVRKIFTSAGCQCLLDLYEKSHHIATNPSKQFNADFLLNYIGHDKENHPASIKQMPFLNTQPEII